ncbi:hypothetical protein [Nocardia mangyaensis]|uniref:hypothetical protein n=1 Tax=Nocardia mangyaensis TaxID=2213200 RepID=UPI002675EC5F|nr:hypothetical protein [Nocardia mangyaensis]MDO3647794.1 hypothetical protein [Nocardia mangyaensis]
MRWEQAESLLAVAQSADLVRMRRGAIDDPCFYETLAFVPQCSEHQLDMAVSGAALVALEWTGMQDVVLLIDPLADEDGAHRVYAHDVGTLPGQPFDWWFPDLSDALALIQRGREGKQVTWPESRIDDAWERSARSGRFVLERVLEQSLSFWDEASGGLDELRAAVEGRHGPGSVACERFRRYLDALATARDGGVPTFAERAATDPACVRRGVAAHARRWLTARRS